MGWILGGGEGAMKEEISRSVSYREKKQPFRKTLKPQSPSVRYMYLITLIYPCTPFETTKYVFLCIFRFNISLTACHPRLKCKHVAGSDLAKPHAHLQAKNP